MVPGAPAPILVQSAAAVPSAPVPGAGTPRREAASGGGAGMAMGWMGKAACPKVREKNGISMDFIFLGGLR